MLSSELKDKNGKPVVVPIHIKRTVKHIAVNKIASAYGKYDIKRYLELNRNNVVYKDTKKSQSWTANVGLQLPWWQDAHNQLPEQIIHNENDLVKYSKSNISVSTSKDILT